jgi:hypothetical protein
MATAEEDKHDPLRLGLCADCLHAHQIRSDKDSMFLQCRLSFTDPRFKKYPRLPILQCSGYEKKKSAEG